MHTTGPKICDSQLRPNPKTIGSGESRKTPLTSSLTTVMFSLTPVMIVGSIQYPSPPGLHFCPPVMISAPSFLPVSMYRRTLSRWGWEIWWQCQRRLRRTRGDAYQRSKGCLLVFRLRFRMS